MHFPFEASFIRTIIMEELWKTCIDFYTLEKMRFYERHTFAQDCYVVIS